MFFNGTEIRNSGFDAFATLTYSASPIPCYCFLLPFDATFVNSSLAQGKLPLVLFLVLFDLPPAPASCHRCLPLGQPSLRFALFVDKPRADIS